MGRLIARSADAHSPGLGPGALPLGRSVEHSGWIVAAEASQDRRIMAVVGESTSYRAKLVHAGMRKFPYPYLILALSLTIVVWMPCAMGCARFASSPRRRGTFRNRFEPVRTQLPRA
jgi:hypothetical protein